jgi:hypothetical protein
MAPIGHQSQMRGVRMRQRRKDGNPHAPRLTGTARRSSKPRTFTPSGKSNFAVCPVRSSIADAPPRVPSLASLTDTYPYHFVGAT